MYLITVSLSPLSVAKCQTRPRLLIFHSYQKKVPSLKIFDYAIACDLWFGPSPPIKILATPMHRNLVASLYFLNFRKEITTVLLLCNLHCIAVFLRNKIAESCGCFSSIIQFTKSDFLDCNHFDCYVNNNNLRCLLLIAHFIFQSRISQKLPQLKSGTFLCER